MTTSAPSVALVPVLPEFTTAERLALGRGDLLSRVASMTNANFDYNRALFHTMVRSGVAGMRVAPVMPLSTRPGSPPVLMVDRLAQHM